MSNDQLLLKKVAAQLTSLFINENLRTAPGSCQNRRPSSLLNS